MIILNNLADTLFTWHSNNEQMSPRKSVLKNSKQTSFGMAKTSKQPLSLRRSRSSENVNKSPGGRVKTESVLVRILRNLTPMLHALKGLFWEKNRLFCSLVLWIPNSFKQWKLRQVKEEE